MKNWNPVARKIRKAPVDSERSETFEPPSSDAPYDKPKRPKRSKKKRKKGAQKGHKGHRQEMLKPTEKEPIIPDSCPCGNKQLALEKMELYHIHQQIELPEIQMDVTH